MFVPKTQEQILERMINRVVARTDLNDIADGSDLKQVLAAASREDDDAYFQMIKLLELFDIDKAIGADLDERAKEFNPALISRNPAAKATGEVVFSRVGTVGTVTIPIGTQVQVLAAGAQAAITFVTTEEGTILDTFTTSNNVDVAAVVSGTAGNVAVSTITGFVVKPSGVDAVNNPAALTNGTDLESNDSFRRRLKNQIKGLARAHPDGLESAALTVEDTVSGKRVLFANVVENPLNPCTATLYIDDGSGTAEGTPNVEVAKVVLAAAVGLETFIFLPDKPIKTESLFVLRRTAGTGGSPNGEPTGVLTINVDYTLNPASGQINFLPASFPVGLIGGAPGDTIDADYTNFTGLIQLVQKVIDGDAGDRASFPGYRAAGILVRVLAPSTNQQVVTANITVLREFNQVEVAVQVGAAISAYINALSIGEDVILNELRERSMAIPGMFDIEFTAPTENFVVAENAIARLVSGNLTIV
jgi:uncharacterized phage protein gp47/JayE